MVMVQATLATELENMVPSDKEPDAITALTSAYGTFAANAVGNGVPITPTGVELGKTAMAGVLIGMSIPGAGIVKIPAAVLAFWVAVCGGFAVSFVGSIAAVPPPHASLPAAFSALMPTNMAGGVSLKDAMDGIAGIMYVDAIVGGIVTLPPAIVGPIL